MPLEIRLHPQPTLASVDREVIGAIVGVFEPDHPVRVDTPVELGIKFSAEVPVTVIIAIVMPGDGEPRSEDGNIQAYIPILQPLRRRRLRKNVRKAIELMQCGKRCLKRRAAIASQYFDPRRDHPLFDESKAELGIAIPDAR
jgi:hypothetical protein